MILALAIYFVSKIRRKSGYFSIFLRKMIKFYFYHYFFGVRFNFLLIFTEGIDQCDINDIYHFPTYSLSMKTYLGVFGGGDENR